MFTPWFHEKWGIVSYFTISQFKWQHLLNVQKCEVPKMWRVKSAASPLLSVNAARPLAYLSELSQPWRCWSPSCEVVSETLSLTSSTGQLFISHTHIHTHHTQSDTHKLEISQITLPTSCVLICLLLVFFLALQNASPHVVFTSMFILVLVEFCINGFQADSLRGAGLQSFV